jgi:hypothetical protein
LCNMGFAGTEVRRALAKLPQAAAYQDIQSRLRAALDLLVPRTTRPAHRQVRCTRLTELTELQTNEPASGARRSWQQPTGFSSLSSESRSISVGPRAA